MGIQQLGGIESLEQRVLLSGDGAAAVLAEGDVLTPGVIVPLNAGTRQAVTTDANGVEHRVAHRTTDSGEVLEYSWRVAGGEWNEPQVLHVASGSIDGAMAIAVDQNGDVFVAWSERFGAGSDLFLRAKLSGREAWSDAVRITDDAAVGGQNLLVGLTTTPIADDIYGRSGRTVHFAYDAGDDGAGPLQRNVQFIQPLAHADAPDLVFDQPVFGTLNTTVPLVRVSDTAFRANISAMPDGRHPFRYLGGAVNAIGEEAPPAISTDVLYVHGGQTGALAIDAILSADHYFEQDREMLFQLSSTVLADGAVVAPGGQVITASAANLAAFNAQAGASAATPLPRAGDSIFADGRGILDELSE